MFAFIALPSFLAGQGLGLALGFLAGIFTPGVLRRLRAGLSSLLNKGKAEAAALEAKAKADVQALEKKL